MADHQFPGGVWGSFPDDGHYTGQQVDGGGVAGGAFNDMDWEDPQEEQLAPSAYPSPTPYSHAGGNAPNNGSNYPAGPAGPFVTGQGQANASMPTTYANAHFQQPVLGDPGGSLGDGLDNAPLPVQPRSVTANQNALPQQQVQNHVAYGGPQYDVNGVRGSSAMPPSHPNPQPYTFQQPQHVSGLHHAAPGAAHPSDGLGYAPSPYGHQGDQHQYLPPYQPVQSYPQVPLQHQGHQGQQLPPQHHHHAQQQQQQQQQQPVLQYQIQQVQFPPRPARQQVLPNQAQRLQTVPNSAGQLQPQFVSQYGDAPAPTAAAPAKKKYDPNNPPPVVVDQELVGLRPAQGYPNFRGASFLVVGSERQVQVPLSLQDPAAMADPAKRLGLDHFPGRGTQLPCEIIFEYDNKIAQDPGQKAALTRQLTRDLDAMGKSESIIPLSEGLSGWRSNTKPVLEFDPKVFKLGKLPRRTAATMAHGAAAINTPESIDDSEEDDEEEVSIPVSLH